MEGNKVLEVTYERGEMDLPLEPTIKRVPLHQTFQIDTVYLVQKFTKLESTEFLE